MYAVRTCFSISYGVNFLPYSYMTAMMTHAF